MTAAMPDEAIAALRVALWRAIQCVDLDAANALLYEQRAHLPALLDAGGGPGELPPPLVQAAASAHGRAALVRALLDAGAPLERPDDRGATALFHALGHRDLALAQTLLDAGASPHAANRNGVRVFDKVLATGDMAWVRRFLDDGHRLDHVSKGGNTCLHHAACSDNAELVELVGTRTGLRPDQQTATGHRAVDLVRSLSLFERLRAQCPGMAWDVVFDNGEHSLHQYAGRGAAGIVRALLAQGIDPELIDVHRNRPLHHAAASGDLDTVRALLDAKAKPSPRNGHNLAPLHRAAEHGHADIVRCLLERGAAVNARGNAMGIIRETPTPLSLAAAERHREVAEILLAHGADPNLACDDSQRTALYEAVHNDDLALCTLLLDHGATPNGIDRDEPGDYFSFPLQQARSAAMVELLVARGADVCARNRQRTTALHTVADRLDDAQRAAPAVQAWRPGLLDALRALLRHGADPNAVDGNGYTPLALCKDPDAGALLADAMTRPQRPPAAPQPDTARRQAAQDAHAERIRQAIGAPAPSSPAASPLGAALFAQCKSVGSQAELDGIAATLARADRAVAEYVSGDPHLKVESTLQRLLYAIRRSNYDTPSRPPVAAFQPALRHLLELGGGTLNHAGGSWRDTPLHTLLRAALYSHRNADAAARAETDAGFLALARLLLAHGARVDALNRDGVMPLDLACDPALAQLLRAHGARSGAFPEALFHAIERDDAVLFEQALACAPPLEGGGSDVPHQVLRGCTALLHAAVNGRLALALRLVDAGADMRARTAGGLGLLHAAAWHGSVPVLEHFAQHPALDLNALDANGTPALHYLVASEPSPRLAVDPKAHRDAARECALRLVARGARIDVADARGETLADLVPKALLAKMRRAAAKA